MASGLDKICGEFLRYSENIVAPFLTELCNKLYDLSIFPTDWCNFVLIPLFKKGDDKFPDNYRGISLLRIVRKLFTAVFNKRVYMHGQKRKEKLAKSRVRVTLQLTTYLHSLQW